MGWTLDTGNQTCTMQALLSRGQIHSQVLQIQTLGLQKYYCCIAVGDKCKWQQKTSIFRKGLFWGRFSNIIVAPKEKMMVYYTTALIHDVGWVRSNM